MITEVVLASQSPQRRQILDQLGVSYTVHPAGVEELEEGEPAAVARENARRKAAAVAGALGYDGVDDPSRTPILACDTVVSVDGRILGKPGDARDAAASLAALAGREHEVLGGLVLGGREALARTRVRFRALDRAAIDAYVAGGEWRGRAGGYAIQGRGAALVLAIEGDYFNVVGLPVAAFVDLSAQAAAAKPQDAP